MNSKLKSSIDQAVESLVRELQPKQIYLFGSAASGDFQACSDIDLFIIVDDQEANQLANSRKAYRATRDLPYPKDIIVNRETAFRKRSAWTSSIEHEVKSTGKLLYDRP